MKVKGMIIALSACVITLTSPLLVEAQSTTTDSMGTYLQGSDIIVTPYADVIVVKFRTNYSKVQYRRWNETRGYWVDSYWRDL